MKLDFDTVMVTILCTPFALIGLLLVYLYFKPFIDRHRYHKILRTCADVLRTSVEELNQYSADAGVSYAQADLLWVINRIDTLVGRNA